ncbi:hypothetical protein OPV22_011650 [Ensete ventricosum]|uniref:Solute carrier family 40 protein n=1 Tax=Ensete ventricosum TaxID=4639 RepID=A0AAV8RA80_ENSVE|nr:hypothetical protein OPV22_011650 [Ensete ventricosum]
MQELELQRWTDGNQAGRRRTLHEEDVEGSARWGILFSPSFSFFSLGRGRNQERKPPRSCFLPRWRCHKTAKRKQEGIRFQGHQHSGGGPREGRGRSTISADLNKSIIQLLLYLGWAVGDVGAHAPSWIDPIWEQQQGMHLSSSCDAIVSAVRADVIRVWPSVAVVSGWQLWGCFSALQVFIGVTVALY